MISFFLWVMIEFCWLSIVMVGGWFEFFGGFLIWVVGVGVFEMFFVGVVGVVVSVLLWICCVVCVSFWSCCLRRLRWCCCLVSFWFCVVICECVLVSLV